MTINVFDKLNFDDSHNLKQISLKQNYAKIIIDGEVVDITNNMVVAPGRAISCQKLFGKVPTGEPDYRDFFVSHFGIGSGGSSMVNDIITYNGPDICDIDIINPIQLDPGNTSYLTSPSNIEYVCKPIEQDGYFEFTTNTSISCTETYYSTMKCHCQLNNEPTNLFLDQQVKVDEAALYYTNGSETKLFARITFSPKYIDQTTSFSIDWYVIC